MEALYKAPLAEFVDVRNALAARLRKAGDAEASAHVKSLPKPSAAAWALNQVYWRAPDEYRRMIAAGDRLRSLQLQMLGGRAADPREAMQERQAAVRTVLDRALAFLAEAGQPATDATRQRVNITADALATWGSHPHGYEPGYLDRELEPPGFDAIASLGATALRLVKPSGGLSAGTEVPAPHEKRAGTKVPAPQRNASRSAGTEVPAPQQQTRQAAAKADREAARAREAARKRLARALQEAERDAAARRLADDRARDVLARAIADAEAARKELAALERQLTTVRSRAERAERTRADAEASADAAGRAHEQAEDALDRARRDLDEL